MFLCAYPHGSASGAALAGGEIGANRQVCPTIVGGSVRLRPKDAGCRIRFREAGPARYWRFGAKLKSKLVRQPDAPGYGASIASRTFLDKSVGLKGFCRKNVPGFDMASRTALLLM